jgi:hypothetical protein
VVDVSAQGTVETKPVSDEDGLRVERGALLLAEASNLLKMPRHMVPPGTPVEAGNGGANAPELSPAEIEARVKRPGALEQTRRRTAHGRPPFAQGGQSARQRGAVPGLV